MTDDEQEIISSIAQEVQEYLNAHPRAADTLEGITAWWLPPGALGANQDLVLQALDQLVAREEMVRVRSADGHVLYMRGKQ